MERIKIKKFWVGVWIFIMLWGLICLCWGAVEMGTTLINWIGG